MSDFDRVDYIDGLRQLADLLQENPDIPVPYDGSAASINWILLPREDQKGILAAIARALPGKVEKRVRGDAFDLVGRLAGLHVKVIADRDEVCARVVTGTETVTKTIPDPDVKVPLVTVTETVETVEWVCGSLLAPGAEVSA